MKKPHILAVIALVLMATLSPVATAQAAAPAPKGPVVAGLPTTVESPGTTSASVIDRTRTARAACNISFTGNGPAAAVVLCGSIVSRLDWPDGRYEFVVIGSDRQIWHSYQYSANGSWSTWATLGNSNNVQDGAWAWFSGGNPTVQVLGGNGGYWCDTFNGSWSNWYAC
ncbi:hypothetical protein OG349_06720 [Streptomyces sp. NBC_01317]|uniref:hypothetical protein n=1 Tax=Streptomyces sp. NBC_01317 TaxID=2903822 RepID=UPI002E10AE90|nr:hypothetical protein OG349_06720 [Streptomyces sp. NBC_01317]